MLPRILLASVLVLAMPCAAWAGEADVQDLLPADAIVAACYYGVSSDVEETALYKLLQEPEVKTWLASLQDWTAGDEVYVYNSRRNDGYYNVLSVSSTTMTLAVGESVVSELSGASILVSLVKWPKALKYIAAQMVKFDHDDRPTRAAGLTSQSLGPRSESYATTDTGAYGYPADLIDALPRRVRLM